VSAALYIVLHRAAAAEQALSPGETSFGVAALGMMHWPPIIVAAAGGLLGLFLGMSALAFHRLRNPDCLTYASRTEPEPEPEPA
jgi:hypothetical protein